MNGQSATIRFYGSLNDFLKKPLPQNAFSVSFSGSPAVKDTIENCGVPHPEIDLILVNSRPVDFKFKIRGGDFISVYPYMDSLRNTQFGLCLNISEKIPSFVIDINLVKLGRYLRMLGFDTLLAGSIPDSQIAQISFKDNRILLSRDIDLLKHKIILRGYWVRNQIPHKQLAEIIRYFDIRHTSNPFTRCIQCNGLLQPIKKEKIEDRLEPKVRQYYTEFHICPDCCKIYWKGPHYDKMLQLINSFGAVLKVD